jgi:hypothetical protein
LPPRKKVAKIFTASLFLKIIFIFYLFSSPDVSAQVFTVYNPGTVSLTSTESTKFNNLVSQEGSSNVKLVSTTDVRNIQIDGRVRFLLPDIPGDTLIADASLISERNGYTWSATLANGKGYATFIYQSGLAFGYIHHTTGFYEILPINTQYQALVKRGASPNQGCADGSESPGTIGPDAACEYDLTFNFYNTCPAVVSVLFVITNEAKNWIIANYGTNNAFVAAAQATVNQAFVNSDIPNKMVIISWVEADLSGELSVFKDIESDRFKLPDLIGAYRDAAQADMAALITHQEYSNAAGAVTNFGPDFFKAFMLVEAPFAVENYTFAHEFGHLLGCRHNWPIEFGDNGDPICAHARRYFEPPAVIYYNAPTHLHEINSWATLLGVPPHGPGAAIIIKDDIGEYLAQVVLDNRILHYSNPDIYYGYGPSGQAISTGRPNSDDFPANNAAFIRNDACTVADFFPTQDLNVFIASEDVPTPLNPCIDPVYTAEVIQPAEGLPGQGPYTYAWYLSTSGQFPPNLATVGTAYTLNFGEHHPACNVYWLKVVVSSPDGVVVSTIRKITLPPVCCTTPGVKDRDDAAPLPAAIGAQDVTLFPNPVSGDFLQVQCPKLKNGWAPCHLVNSLGQLLEQTQLGFDAQGSGYVRTRQLPDGLYYLNIQQDSGAVISKKFIINNH